MELLQRIFRTAAICLLLTLGLQVSANSPAEASSSPERVALVIGNSNYPFAPLDNPKNDATGMAALLGEAGFAVDRQLDANQASLRQAVEQFGRAIRSPQVKFAIFYYAGHGVQLDWRNYLVPVDARVKAAEDVRRQAVDVSELLRYMQDTKEKSFLVILDACRDDPFAGSYRAPAKGLSQFDAPVGSLLAYSTAPGNVALDGKGQNGLYTSHLLREFAVRNAKLEDAFKRVRLNVRIESGGKQIPWESTSLEEDLYLFPNARKKLSEAEQEALFEREVKNWMQVKSATEPQPLIAFIREFPSGSTSELAQSRLNRLLLAQSLARAQGTGPATATATAPAMAAAPTPPDREALARLEEARAQEAKAREQARLAEEARLAEQARATAAAKAEQEALAKAQAQAAAQAQALAQAQARQAQLEAAQRLAREQALAAENAAAEQRALELAQAQRAQELERQQAARQQAQQEAARQAELARLEAARTAQAERDAAALAAQKAEQEAQALAAAHAAEAAQLVQRKAQEEALARQAQTQAALQAQQAAQAAARAQAEQEARAQAEAQARQVQALAEQRAQQQRIEAAQAAERARAEEARVQAALVLEAQRKETLRIAAAQEATRQETLAQELAASKAQAAREAAVRAAELAAAQARKLAQEQAAALAAQQAAADKAAAEKAAAIAATSATTESATSAGSTPAGTDTLLAAATLFPVALPATPYYKGLDLHMRRYAVGDEYGFAVIDQFTKVQTPLNLKVSRVDEVQDRVEYNGGEYTSDTMGNITRNVRGTMDAPRQFYPAELFVGKKWRTQFSQTRANGTVYHFYYDIKVTGRERVTVPAGTFDAYRLEAQGFNVELGASLQRRIWVAPGVNADIAHETIVRLRSGRFEQNDRQELVRYQPANMVAQQH